MGKVDLVPVAFQPMELLGKHVTSDLGKDWVIAVDISDIHKKYAEKMEALDRIRDGFTGEINVPGYGFITGSTIDLNSSEKVMPLPLLLEVFSPVEEDFKSQPAVWMSALDSLMNATTSGTFAIDSEVDSNRSFDKCLARKRHFVIRVYT